MSNLQFTEKEYNSFLKEYIINKKVNPNKENLEIFQKFSEIKNYQHVFEMIKYILYYYIPNEKLIENDKISLYLHINNLIKNFHKYGNLSDNTIDTKITEELCKTLYNYLWNSDNFSSKKTFKIISESFKLSFYHLKTNEVNNLLNNFFENVKNLNKLNLTKCSEIFIFLSIFIKHPLIQFDNEKINSLIIIMKGILNVLINNLQNPNIEENFFLENIIVFTSLLNLTIKGLKTDLFYEIYQNENDYFLFLQKTSKTILENIDNSKVKQNGNLSIEINICKFKSKILMFLLILFLKSPSLFSNLIELFKFLLLYLNNFINSENVNEKLSCLGFEENNDEFLQYIKIILLFILSVLKQRINNISLFFKESAFDFIQKILLVFIDIELKDIELTDLIKESDIDILIEEEQQNNKKLNKKINYDNSIFTNCILLIKEIIEIYPNIFEQLCNLSLNLIESNKSYIGYYLIIQLSNINSNSFNLSNYISDNINKILNVSFDSNIPNSEINIYHIINFLYAFSKNYIDNQEIIIKSISFIYNNFNSVSIPIRKNSILKLCFMIKEINLKLKENENNNIKEIIKTIIVNSINNIIEAPIEYINFFNNGLDNCIFENNSSIFFCLFKAISERIKIEFNKNNKSEENLSNCFKLLIKIFKNDIYKNIINEFLNEAMEVFLNNVIPLIQLVQTNNFDDEIFEILYLFYNKSINYPRKDEIYKYLKFIPNYIQKNNCISNAIYKFLNIIIEKESKEIQCEYLQDIFSKILSFKYKVKEDSSIIKICILLQCLVYSNDSLSEIFISETSKFAFNKIMNSVKYPDNFYYYNSIISLISYVFSLFNNYNQIIMNIININNSLYDFILNVKNYLNNSITFNILQAKFNVFLLCDIVDHNYYKQSSFLFLKICYDLIIQISFQEKNKFKNLDKKYLKTKFIEEEEENELSEEENYDIDLNEINKIYFSEKNIILRIKEQDEFKKFSECFHQYYKENKDIIEKEFLRLMNENEKKNFINIIHTYRIDSNIFYLEKDAKNYYNQNGGIPRKIIKIKRNSNLININNNNKMDI